MRIWNGLNPSQRECCTGIWDRSDEWATRDRGLQKPTVVFKDAFEDDKHNLGACSPVSARPLSEKNRSFFSDIHHLGLDHARTDNGPQRRQRKRSAPITRDNRLRATHQAPLIDPRSSDAVHAVKICPPSDPDLSTPNCLIGAEKTASSIAYSIGRKRRSEEANIGEA